MAVEFTLDEMRGILLEAGLSPDQAADLARSLGASASVSALEDLLMSQLQGKVAPELLESALAQARRQAKRITGDILQAELNKIAEKVSDNIAAGLSPVELAGRLDEIKGLDRNRAAAYENYKAALEQTDLSNAEIEKKLDRVFNKLLNDRLDTIARTEQRFATSGGKQKIAEGRGKKYKVWITVGDDRVSDMDRNNEGEGWIKIDQSFSSGDLNPPSHPNCRCTVSYRTSPPDDFARQRVEDRVKRTADAEAEAAAV